MKHMLTVLVFLLFSRGAVGQWLPDSILNDRNTVNRTGYTTARGIAADGNNLYAVWTEAGYRIFLRTNVGGSWSPSEEVSVGSPGGIYGTSAYPSIALHGGDIHIVWEDYRTGDFEIFYRRFSGGWGTPINLTGDTAQSRNAVITVTGSGRRFLVWQDNRSGIYNVYGKVYENGAWGAPVRLSNALLYAGFPTIAHYDETVYVVWEQMEQNGYELYCCMHTGGGWTAPQRITDSQGLSLYPSLCITPTGIPHLVFADDRNGSFDIYYKRYNGSDWSPDSLLTEADPGEALYPQITADPFGNLHLVWSGNGEGQYEIHYRRRLSGGIWSADTMLSFTGATSSLPHITAATDGSIHVLWYDWVTDPVFLSPHIRYRRYDAILELLSSSMAVEATSQGVWVTAAIPKADLSLFRIEAPFAAEIDHVPWNGEETVWYDERAPGDYRYILQLRDGTVAHYSKPFDVHIPEKPQPVSLSFRPNPFTTATTVSILGGADDRNDGTEELRIYDVSGKVVRRFSLGASPLVLPARLEWDGRDQRGKKVGPGVYFIQYRADRLSLTKKVVKL